MLLTHRVLSLPAVETKTQQAPPPASISLTSRGPYSWRLALPVPVGWGMSRIRRGVGSSTHVSSSHVLADANASSDRPPAGSYDKFLALAHELADASGEILLKYFRKPVEIIEKHDLSEF